MILNLITAAILTGLSALALVSGEDGAAIGLAAAAALSLLVDIG